MIRPAQLRRLTGHLLLVLAAVLFVSPILFMIAAGFTPDDQVLPAASRGWPAALLPVEPSLQNYRDVFARMDFLRFMVNSLIIVSTTVVAGLAINSMAGFALARLSWAGRRAILVTVVALMVIPFEAIAVPLFFIAVSAGQIDTYAVQIVPFIANPFSIYLFYTFFRDLPREIDEAALLDGAGPWRLYWDLAVPLARPAFASVTILTFLMYWGAYLWPLMVTTGPEVRPLPVAIGEFPNEQPVQWGDIMAFATLMILPVMTVFLVFQRWFVRGLAATGVKG